MRKRQIILAAMIIGLLTLGAIQIAQPAAAQSSPKPTRTATPTRTPTPTPLGGIDTQTKAKILIDINNNLNQGENKFANLQFDESIKNFQTALDSIRKYKDNDAFLNDKDK